MAAIDRINKKLKKLEEEKKTGKKTSLESSMSNIEELRNELNTTGKIDYVDTSGIIAPVRTNTNKNTSSSIKDDDLPWYKKIFTKGEFEDGYQFGDVTKTILGTGMEVQKNISKGAVSVIEAPIDILTNATASGLNALGFKKSSEKVRDFANKDLSSIISNTAANNSVQGTLYNAITGKPLNTLNPAGLKYNNGKSLIENISSINKQLLSGENINNDYEKSSLSGYYADKTTELVGYTLGMIFGTKGLDKAITGGSAAINTAKGTTAIGAGIKGGNITATVAGKTLNLPILAITGGMSSGLQEANSKEDVTEAERWSKALSSGLIEGTTEGLFGMFGVGGNEFTDVLGEKAAKAFSSKAGKMLAKIGISSTGEAAEEFLSYAGNYLADNNIIDKIGNADFSQEWDWGEVGEQMALAFASSVITQGGGTMIQTNSSIAAAEKELGRKLTKDEKAQVTQASIEGTLEDKLNKLTSENEVSNTTTQEEQTNSLVEAPINTLNNVNEQIQNRPVNEELSPVKSGRETTINSQVVDNTLIDNNNQSNYNANKLEVNYGREKTSTYGQETNEINRGTNGILEQSNIEQTLGENVPKRKFSREEYQKYEKELNNSKTTELNDNQINLQNTVKTKSGKDIVFFNGDKLYKGGSSLDNGNVIYVSSELNDNGQSFVSNHEIIESEIMHNEDFRENYAKDVINEIINDSNFSKVRENFIGSDLELQNASDYLIAKDVLADIYAEHETGINKGYEANLSKDTLDFINYAIDRLNEGFKKNAQNNKNTVQNSIPTKEELDTLENIRQNKSGSEYASAFFDLRDKYGQTNLYKGINEYNSNAKKGSTNVETTQNVQEELAPIKEAAKELKQVQKEVSKQVKELKKEIAPIKEMLEDVKSLTEKDLPMFEKQASERFKYITEEDMPPVIENTNPEQEMTESKSLFETRNYEEVGNPKINSYQYDNPEVRPYFQEAAISMLSDLDMSTKGERFIIGDTSQLGNGNYEYSGTKRQTTSDIAELLDGVDGKYKYSYDDIKKGLEAIIEDHGAENIAVSKRIEFYLDQRLRNGYTTLDGYDVPANQEYLNTLREKEFSDYYSSLPINENEPIFEEEIAPVKKATPVKEKYEAIEPRKEPKMIRIKPDRAAFNENVERTSQEVKNDLGYIPKDPTRAESYKDTPTSEEQQKIAEILTEEPTTEKRKQRLWATVKANVFDKGAVFEDLSLKNKNRDLMGKWDYTITSEARAQNVIGNGHTEYNADTKETIKTSKSLNEIKSEVDNTGLTKEFYEYMYHKHNVDRMSLESRANAEINKLSQDLINTTDEDIKNQIKQQIEALSKQVNKPVFGYDVTSEQSQEIVNQYEFSNPEFMDFAQDVYDYLSADRQQLVKEGVISQETADLWAEMYPHYVPIRRVNDSGLNINVPLDTNRTGINAPVKKATGGNADILPLFDTMAQRTMQTYRAVAKNSFGVELKKTLGTNSLTEATNLDEVIDSVDNQEGLLKEGKNGANPTFTVFENGEKNTFEITQDMYDALKPLSDSSLLSKTITPLNKASNFHRGVLTEYNPVFMLTNAVKDAQDVLINSQHAAKTYSKIPEAYAQLIKKGYWYQEYISNGGEQNSYFDSQDNTFKTENKGIAKVLDHGPLKWISQMNNFIEMTPRLAEYIASRESGRSVEVSMLDAARVTTNFKAGGNLTKFLNRNGATFLNASVQGAMQQIRNVREAKMNGAKGWANLATKFAIAGLPAILLNGLVWKDDEDYEELSEYVKQNYYIVGKYGDGQFIRIPKGRTVAVIQDAINQIDKVATGDDEADLKSFLDLVLTNLAPNNPIENNILSPIIQVANNKTWYGEDLVPTRLQDLPAKEQTDESIDAISNFIGNALNVSPYKVNYLLDQYTGGIGDTILPMLTPEATSGNDTLTGQILAPFTKKFTTDSTMNNKNVGKLYETSEKLTTGAKKSDAKEEDLLKNKFINSVKADMGELYKQKREIQGDNTLTKSEKYEKIREIQKEINQLAKAGLNNYEDLNVYSDYATVSDASYRKDSQGKWVTIKEDELNDLDELNMTNSEKNTYFKTKNDISLIVNDYKEDKEDLNSNDEDTLKEEISSLSSEKKSSIINSISNSGLNDKQQAYLYKKYYNTDTIDTIINSEIAVSNYFDYVQQEFKADYNSDGKVISGSRKDKVISYINKYDLTIPQKAILIKSTNTFKFNDYNEDIISYVDGLDLDYEIKIKILKDLDMEVDNNGNVRW